MIFVHHSPFLDILPGKFQSIANIRTHDFGTFIPKNLRPPLIFLVPCLGWTTNVPFSLSPSCMTRKKTARKKHGRAKTWGREEPVSPPGFHTAIFFAVFVRVTLDKFSERGTTSKSWRELDKMMPFSQLNTTRVEIIITISTAIR